jgi:hypothetical protein
MIYLFVEELKIGAALVFAILLFLPFFLLGPGIVIPSPLIFFILVIVCRSIEWEVVFQCFFTI